MRLIGLGVVLALSLILAPLAAADSGLLGRWIHTDRGRTLTIEFAAHERAVLEGLEGRYVRLDEGRLRLIVGRHECADRRDRDCDWPTELGGSTVAVRLPVDRVLRFTVNGDTMTVTGWIFKDAVFRRR
jgi:hypothetical protein